MLGPFGHGFIEILLKSHKHLVYLFRPAEIGDSVGNGVAILQAKQRRQLLLVEFIHSDADIMSQNEFQSVAVAERWAKDGMPVERKGRSMTARPEELKQWLGKEAGTKEPVHIAQSGDEDLLPDLRRGLKQMRKTHKHTCD